LSPRQYLDRIADILTEIDNIQSFIVDMDYESFVADEKTKHAVQMSLIIIGEAGNSIPELIQEKYNEIPWNLIRAMRNRLIHVYFNFDDQILWDTLKIDLPLLEKGLRNFNS
jgi:uncharacterized protein with HEPN domain